MTGQRGTLLVATCVVLAFLGTIQFRTPVLGQTGELRIARSALNEILMYTVDYSVHYFNYFKLRQEAGFLKVDEKFASEFATTSSTVKKTIEALKDVKAPLVTSVDKSKTLALALDDKLKGRGLEFKGEPISPSERPKTVSDLSVIFEYRVSMLSDLVGLNTGKVLGPRELFNLQNHMHSLRQIAIAFQVGGER